MLNNFFPKTMAFILQYNNKLKYIQPVAMLSITLNKSLTCHHPLN